MSEFLALCSEAERVHWTVGLGVGALIKQKNAYHRNLSALSVWPRGGRTRDGITVAIREGEPPEVAAATVRVELARKLKQKK